MVSSPLRSWDRRDTAERLAEPLDLEQREHPTRDRCVPQLVIDVGSERGVEPGERPAPGPIEVSSMMTSTPLLEEGGKVRGAIAGGLLIGVVDNLSAAYVSTQYRAAVSLILLIVIILFRPQGLLGRPEARA